MQPGLSWGTPTGSSASVGLTNFSQVDMLGVRYKSRNLRVGQSPLPESAPTRLVRPNQTETGPEPSQAWKQPSREFTMLAQGVSGSVNSRAGDSGAALPGLSQSIWSHHFGVTSLFPAPKLANFVPHTNRVEPKNGEMTDAGRARGCTLVSGVKRLGTGGRHMRLISAFPGTKRTRHLPSLVQTCPA